MTQVSPVGGVLCNETYFSPPPLLSLLLQLTWELWMRVVQIAVVVVSSTLCEKKRIQ